MGREIERKFLVTDGAYRKGARSALYRQGYISRDLGGAVRVRIAGRKAFLTIKAKITDVERLEFEYAIPLNDAREMLDQLCAKPILEKTRHTVQYRGHTWVVDEFLGANLGLVVAEIELNAPDARFDLPPWAGREVTADPRYLSVNLVAHPYAEWREEGPDAALGAGSGARP